MKSIFAIIVSLAFAASVFAAGPDDVAGVHWESSSSQIKQILAARPEVALASETPETLVFTGGNFGGFNVNSWKFTLVNGKMISVLIKFSPKAGKDEKGWFADQDFWSIDKLLEQKYGKSRAVKDPNFQSRSWEFKDNLYPRATKTIELYRGWAGERNGLELTYNYKRDDALKPSAGATPKPGGSEF